MGSRTQQQQYDIQQLPQNRLREQPDPNAQRNAQRNALTAQLNRHGELGDKARRESAALQLKSLDDQEQNTQNNLAKQQIADAEIAQKAPYYQSVAAENYANAQAKLMPPQPQPPQTHWGEDGNARMVNNGQVEVIPKSSKTLFNEENDKKLADGEIDQKKYLENRELINQ
jgi:hypothetical protein